MKHPIPLAVSALALLALSACTGSSDPDPSDSAPAEVSTPTPTETAISAADIEAGVADATATFDGYALDYELVDAELAAQAAAADASVYIAAPLFAFDQEVFELSPALQPRAVVELTESDVIAMAESGGQLHVMNTDCLSPSNGYAFCSNVGTVTSAGLELDAATADFGLDFHGLWFDTDDAGHWVMRYTENECDASLYPCGLGAEDEDLPVIYDCEIAHYRDGESVWEWSALEHVPNAMLDQGAATAIYTANDPYHCNSVQLDEDANLLYVSMRHVNAGLAIDVESGDVVWTFGAYDGPEALTIDDPEGMLGDRQILSGNHDFHWLGGDRFSIFDNGSAGVGPARVVIFTVDGDTATIENVIDDPKAADSGCTGSARPIDAEGAFWAISWGCSTSGVSVVAADGSPVAHLTVNVEKALEEGLIEPPADTIEFLTPSVSYQAVVGSQGLLG